MRAVRSKAKLEPKGYGIYKGGEEMVGMRRRPETEAKHNGDPNAKKQKKTNNTKAYLFIPFGLGPHLLGPHLRSSE